MEEVKKTYDKIAESFDQKRTSLNEDIKNLFKMAKPKETILDFGCGNGRAFPVFKEIGAKYYGVDVSEKLLKLAKKKFPEANFLLLTNFFQIPYPENFFDKIYAISVFHHIPSQTFRKKILKEFYRVLKPGGKVILSVWDFWNKRGGKSLIFKFLLLKIFKNLKIDFFDVFLPWKNEKGEILAQRYFHCFTKKEITFLLKDTGFCQIQVWRSGRDHKTNIYAVAQKPLT